jgi:hypothetical protein
MEKKLIKVDRNGTKYFLIDKPCDRCGGAGGADKWKPTGWTCYKCGGTGKQEGSWNEYTPEYVDLGLSVKWATCNIGAKTPEENGMYFSWGDIESFKLVGQENWDIEEVARLYLIYIGGTDPENITPEAI